MLCSGSEVLDAKRDGNVLNCAYYNAQENEYNRCGDGLAAACHLDSDISTPSFNIDANTSINSYGSMECADAFFYGRGDFGSLNYTVDIARRPIYYITTDVDLSGKLDGCLDGGCDISEMRNNLASDFAPLYWDNSGGNFVNYFDGDPDSIVLDTLYVVGKPAVEEPSMHISKIDSIVHFENLVSCAMQPTEVLASLSELDSIPPDKPFIPLRHDIMNTAVLQASVESSDDIVVDACNFCGCGDFGIAGSEIIECVNYLQSMSNLRIRPMLPLTPGASNTNRVLRVELPLLLTNTLRALSQTRRSVVP